MSGTGTGTGTDLISGANSTYADITYNGNQGTLYECNNPSGSYSLIIPSGLSSGNMFAWAIAGGGGGGDVATNYDGGGGGSGAVISDYDLSAITAGTYSITIGAPGTAGASNSAGGTGGNTSVSTLIAQGGLGGYQGDYTSTGSGTGDGLGGVSGIYTLPGGPTTNTNGGNGGGSTVGYGGGGGGFTSSGSNGSTAPGAAGGLGISLTGLTGSELSSSDLTSSFAAGGKSGESSTPTYGSGGNGAGTTGPIAAGAGGSGLFLVWVAAPTAVTGLVASNITSSGFTVSYTGGLGAGVIFSATAYSPLGMSRRRVLAAGRTIVSNNVTSTRAIFTGLTPTYTYTVSVLANNAGGSTSSSTLSVTTTGVVAGPPCFLRGSKILCLNEDVQEYLPIEKLKVGNLVKTLDGTFQPIHSIGSSIFKNPDNADRGPNRLFKLSPANYPSLKEDLILTGCHSLLVDDMEPRYKERHIQLMKRLFVTTGKYRLMSFIDEKAEPYINPGDHEIWHLALENENTACNYGIYANGLLVESASIDTMRETGGLVLIP